MRKRCTRRPVTPMPPRGMRPRLSADQQRDLGIVHLEILDALAKGQADHDTLWNWAGGVFTWSRIAERLRVGIPEMTEQLKLVASVIERFGRTGRALFVGPEYQLAKLGVGYMDDLAEIVDRHTAIQAAHWSEDLCSRLASKPTADALTTLRGLTPQPA